MTLRSTTLAVAAGALWALSSSALAAVSAEEAKKLGNELTPIGANPDGNEAGTIPPWNPQEQEGPLTGEYPSDPEIDAEEPKFTITADNMAEYADKLSRS